MKNKNEISFDRLIKASNGDEAFVRSMLELFIERTPGIIDEMRLACKNDDDAKTVRLAHQLKPSVDMIGNPQMRNILMELYSLTQANSHCKDSSDLIDEFISQTNKVSDLIKTKLNLEKLF